MRQFLTIGFQKARQVLLGNTRANNLLIALMGILLISFSVGSIVSNRSAQEKIQQMQKVHLVVPHQVAKLYNLVNLASTAQNNFFISEGWF